MSSTYTATTSSTYPSTTSSTTGTAYTTSEPVHRPGVAVGQTVSSVAQGINNTLASIAKTGAAAVGINPSPNNPGLVVQQDANATTHVNRAV